MSWASHTGGAVKRKGAGAGSMGGSAAASAAAAALLPAAAKVAADGKVTEVHVEGLVVLKIIKHCRDAFPENVAGSLLGYEKDDGLGGALSGVLEVTHSFPALPEDDFDDAAQSYDQRYEVRMVKALKEINVDQSSVGWYSSNFLSSYFTSDTIAHQARYQLTVPSAVLLSYDSVRTGQGHLALRALRLSDAAMAAYRAALADVQRSGRAAGLDEDRLTKAVLASEAFLALSPSQVFEELPVRVRNAHLAQAMLADLVDCQSLRPVASAAAAASRGLGSAAALALQAAAAGTIGGSAVLGGGQQAQAAAAAVSPAAAAMAAGLPAAPGTAAVSAASAASSAAAAASAAALSSSAAAEAEDTDFARLSLSTVPYLEKHLEVLNGLMGEVAKVQDSAAYVQRKMLRMAREREEWTARRRKENEDRAQQGLGPLPTEDFSLPFFQPLREKGQKEPLEAILYAAQITSYCGSVSRFSYQSFPKLFLATQMTEASAQAATQLAS